MTLMHGVAHMGKTAQTAPEVSHENLTIRVPQEWLDRLDAWRAAQPVPPKRGEVIKVAVAKFVASKG